MPFYFSYVYLCFERMRKLAMSIKQYGAEFIMCKFSFVCYFNFHFNGLSVQKSFHLVKRVLESCENLPLINNEVWVRNIIFVFDIFEKSIIYITLPFSLRHKKTTSFYLFFILFQTICIDAFCLDRRDLILSKLHW